MSTTENSALVNTFFEKFSAGDVPAVMAIIDDYAIWKVMGRDGDLPLSGEMGKSDIVSLMHTVHKTFPDGMELSPSAWTSEGERVAVEVESYGKKVNGTLYNNAYHFLFTAANGKITSIREYMDTLHVKSVFIDD